MDKLVNKVSLVVLGIIAGVMISLNFSAIADKTLKDELPALPIEELRAFTQVFGRIKSDYVEPVDDKKLITEAINGMLVGLDPHSAYLDSEEYKELQIGTQGEFGGLGIQVTMEDGLVKVISPIEDTPAFRAGIKTGDLIIKLDDTAVKGMTLNEAIKRMRGKPDTAITITIAREGEAEPLVFTLVRAIIKIESVKSKLVEPGYGYLRITQFQEQTGENLAKAIDKLFKESKLPMKGLVLDLRNDPGGLLNSAVAVSAAFLPSNALVVYTEGRTTDAKMRLLANPEYYLRGPGKDYLLGLPDAVKTVPMVTLVNGGSASASEIVAGALQDHKRSIVMGTQTFGKGSVQTILPLGNNTAIKLTTARYYTPNGQSIQAKGITPDIIDDESEESSRQLRESDLSRHLRSNNGETSDEKTAAEPKKQNEATDKVKSKKSATDKVKKKTAPAEFGSNDDALLAKAITYLKSSNGNSKRKNTKTAKSAS